jgi:kinesin family member 20
MNVNQHSERIKVYLRIRPFTEQERSVALDESCISVENEHSVVLLPPRQSHAFRASMYGVSRQQHRFLFNRVFKEDTTQMQFFDEAVKDTITEFVDGQRCLVFSYGVTNSGKTYTMQGDTRQEGAGIIPRSLNQLFTMVSSSQVTGIHFKPIMFGDVARLTAEQVCSWHGIIPIQYIPKNHSCLLEIEKTLL